MMSIKCLPLRLEDGLGVGWHGAHSALRLRRAASNELLSSEMFIAPRFLGGEKPIYSRFLLQLDYNNSHSSHLSFKFSPYM